MSYQSENKGSKPGVSCGEELLTFAGEGVHYLFLDTLLALGKALVLCTIRDQLECSGEIDRNSLCQQPYWKMKSEGRSRDLDGLSYEEEDFGAVDQ